MFLPGSSESTSGVEQRPWWLGWCLSRIVVIALVYLASSIVSDDSRYYIHALGHIEGRDWSRTLPEYPLPIAVALWPLKLATDQGLSPAIAVLVPLLVVDLWFCRALHHSLGAASVRCWVWGVLLIGPVAVQRIDIVPGVLLAASVLTWSSVRTGAIVSLGVAAKVFPGLGILATLSTAARPLVVALSSMATGLALVAVSTATAGWDRTVSPLTYQATRGLQVESVAATPFVLARMTDRGRWPAGYAASKSVEIRGPGTAAALDVAQAVQGLVVVALICLAVYTRSRYRTGPAQDLHEAVRSATVWSLLAAMCGFISTSRVFSPQYMMWVLPLVAIAVATSPRRVRIWLPVLAVTLVLTQVLFPSLYGGLTKDIWASWPASAVITIRNLLFLVLTVEAFRQAFSSARDLGRPHLEPQADSIPS